MEQPEQVLGEGAVVRTGVLDTTRGFILNKKHLQARRPDTIGVILGTVPGHGGDVYWVQHPDVEVAAPYAFTEFEFDGAKVVWPVTYSEDGKVMRCEYASLFDAQDGADEFGDMSDVKILPALFEDREPVAGPVDVTPDRRSAWDHLQDDDV